MGTRWQTRLTAPKVAIFGTLNRPKSCESSDFLSLAVPKHLEFTFFHFVTKLRLSHGVPDRAQRQRSRKRSGSRRSAVSHRLDVVWDVKERVRMQDAGGQDAGVELRAVFPPDLATASRLRSPDS